MGKRRGQKRVGYRNLSKPYKARLVRAGISQRQWEDGADLRTARGHKPTPPKYVAPAPLISNALEGELSGADLAELRQWQGSQRPAWIPDSIRVDVAATLSQLPPPTQWSEVVLYPRPGGDTWTMHVEFKGARYPIDIEIPGGGVELSGAWQVLDLLSNPPDSRQWKEWSYDQLRVDRTGSQ